MTLKCHLFGLFSKILQNLSQQDLNLTIINCFPAERLETLAKQRFNKENTKSSGGNSRLIKSQFLG